MRDRRCPGQRPRATRRFHLVILAALVLVCAAAGRGLAEERGRVTGLPIPRFVSLNAERVNLRVGPGFRYPISWVLQRRGLPVEIDGEFDIWRHIRLHDGTQGWVSRVLLSARRTVIFHDGVHVLRAAPRAEARPVARLSGPVIGELLSCARGAAWCRLKVRRFRGFAPRAALWGIAAQEAF